MKGDFTRFTFRPEKRYTSVRMQQGRVQLDADWNEQIDIQFYQQQAAAAAFIGGSGAPSSGGGFQIGIGNSLDLTISSGRYFVNGLLCELFASDSGAALTYLSQPDYPLAPALSTLATGAYLVYLDVWTRHVTALEDEELREVALEGPDTSTRTQTVWQVKLVKLPALPALSDAISFAALLPQPDLRLAARTSSSAAAGATPSSGAGYQRLDNLLYRVEIHRGGIIGQDPVVYKWSRDNGATASEWIKQNGNDLVIGTSGKGDEDGFAIDDWVELSDDGRELRGEPGILVRVANVEGRILTIDPAGATINFANFPRNPKVRRWVGTGPLAATGSWLPLEEGIEIYFSGTTTQTGDYWLIPARTATRDVLWPKQNNQPALLKRKGIGHDYAALAQFQYTGSAITNLADRRYIFPALIDLRTADMQHFEQALTTHTHTGDTDGKQIPRAGIANAAIDGTKIDSAATVSIATLGVSGAATVGSTLGVAGQLNLASTLHITGSEVHLDNTTSRGGRSGSNRRALVHDSSDYLTVNASGDYSSGVKLGGQLTMDGRICLADNNIYLRSAGNHNNGVGYFGSNRPFAGSSVDGPGVYGNAGGVLGTLVAPATGVEAALVLTGGYVTLPNNMSDDFSGGMTVEAWVYFSSFGNNNARIVDLGTATAGQENIIFSQNGQDSGLNFTLYKGASLYRAYSAAQTLATNTWTHVAVTINASGVVKMYKNGSALAFTAVGTAALPSTTTRTANFIGKSSLPNDGYFAGKLAHVRLWTRALTADELTDRYSNTRAVNTANLVGWWPLDEGTGTSARDKSSNSRTGTLSNAGAAFETYQSSALTWDRTSNVSVGKNLTAGGTLSVTGNSTLGGTLGVTGNTTVGGTLGVTGNTTVGGTLGVTGALSAANITSSGTDFSIDNSSRRGTRTSGQRRALTHDSSDYLTVNTGGDYSSGVKLSGQLTMDGRTYLADNNIYLRKAGDPNHGVGYFGSNRPFAGSSVDGPGVYGYSGGVLGTIASPPTTSVEAALVLSGGATSGYVTLPNNMSDNFSGGMTIEAWVYFSNFSSSTSNGRIIDLGTATAGAENIVLAQYGQDSSLCLYVYRNQVQYRAYSASQTLATNTWTHVAVTIDASGVVKMYKNGSSLAFTAVGTAALPNSVTRTSNFIGKSNWGDPYFAGKLAHVRLWTRALTADELTDRYSNTRAVNTANLVGWWPLDEGTGTSARDMSGNGRNGTLSGTGAAYETYQQAALTWDSSNNVSIGNKLTVGGKLKSSNTRVVVCPTTGAASGGTIAVTTSAWTTLDANMNTSFTTSGDSYVQITVTIGGVYVATTGQRGDFQLLLDGVSVAYSVAGAPGPYAFQTVSMVYCARLTTTSHTVNVQWCSPSGATVWASFNNATRSLLIVEL